MTTFFLEHWLDIVTTVLGLAYILLEYKASVWMWLVGFLMQALGIALYYQKGERSETTSFERSAGFAPPKQLVISFLLQASAASN